ncbi:MAG: excinuclease ABC subunit C [Candidatus Latescibacteria bacterium]|nr:excinuclease ABC subunit C [Candidatus Latescibacterota bacterium]
MNPSLSQDLLLKLDALPSSPGVYFMKDREGQIIYIGKAKNLRSRVRSYFQEGAHDGRRQFKALVQRISEVECLVTQTEQEALILEATQIKTHKPRYNILLKDDKKYPYIRLTHEPFPRIFATRDLVQDGSRYLGPYSNVRAMHTTLMHKIFPLRSCDYKLPSSRVRLCLEYHIHRCGGPCEHLVSAEIYGEVVARAFRFLKGNQTETIRELQERMASAAEHLRFEEAARCRDQLRALESMRARQKAVLDEPVDRDVIGLARHDDEACCCVLEIREGRLLGQKHHFLGGVIDSTDAEIIAAFLGQFYLDTDFIPSQIHLPVPLAEDLELGAWLSARAGARVEMAAPQRGSKAQMLDMAESNAAQLLKERQLKRELQKGRIPQGVFALQRDLRLEFPPRRIECVDISNFHGADAVGSLVCFVDGKPRRSQYRHFKIRDLRGPDDFASIHQVVQRRFRALEEGGEAPDLLLIDGGKGQLSSAVQALGELGRPGQPVAGLAKRLEEVFLPDQSEALVLPRTSASLRLLQQLRDEAHRFALTHHRSLREKRSFGSALDEVPGIGPKRRVALLNAFGSVQRLRETPAEEIAQQVKGLSLKQAHQLKERLAGLTEKTHDHDDE